MSCVGILIEPYTCRAVFNPELAIAQGNHIITNSRNDIDPQILRAKVEAKVRRSCPHVTLKFMDFCDELEVETPNGDYLLVICQESPMYSGSMH